MNIINVNQNLPVQGSNEVDIKKKNVTIAVDEKSNVSFSEGTSKGICRTVVETDITALSEVLGQDDNTSAANKEALDYMANHMTEDDYEDLSEEGYSLEDYEAERLERALERRKENREFREANVTRQVENKEEFREDVKKMAIRNEISDPLARKAAQKLVDCNLPVTEENIEAMLNAVKLSDVVPCLSEDGMAALLEREKLLTLENIYNCQYSSYHTQTPEEGAWELISSQAKDILTQAGIEGTQEDMEKAKWLFDHNLPISENTMDVYNSLLELRGGMDKERLLESIAKAMSKGMAPEQADLNFVLQGKLEQAVADFGTITDDAIDSVINKGEKLNLINLKYAQRELNEQAASGEPAQEAAAQASKSLEELSDAMTDGSGTEITAHRQLEEIRLKLTLESAHTLAQKGIRIDTSPLQQIVEGLKKLEDAYYENLLEEGKAEKTEANLSLLKETAQTVEQVKYVPAAVLGATLSINTAQSMDSLCKTGQELKASYEKAGTAYEALMTEPRKDMGDSIQKAFQNVDSILEGMELETTADNERAVRILGYNRMEINESSIAAVKAYDSQVTTLLNELHPAAAVELIKRGINPLDMPMEQLLSAVKQVKEELGATEEQKYSTYLWKLEKQNGISEEEKKSYIGIYRFLNNLEKTDGAAIGFVLDTGKELTMNNLLTAVRTMKHKAVDTKVDDTFGALETLTFTKETITDQIQAGFSKDTAKQNGTNTNPNGDEMLRQNEMIYQTNTLHEILEKLTPDKLAQIRNEMPGAEHDLEAFMDMSLEQLKDRLDHTTGDREIQKEYWKEKVEAMRAVISESNDALEFLEQYRQPVSIETLAATEVYFTGNKNVFKELQKRADKSFDERTEGTSIHQKEELMGLMEDIIEVMDDPEVLQGKFKELEEKSEEILNAEYANTAISSEELKNLRLLGKGMMLTGSMSRQEHYEIPMITGESVTTVSLTICKGTGEKGKLQICMNSEKFGRMEVEASIKEQAINGVILCESREGLEKIKDCEQELTAHLNELGLTVKQLSVAVSDKALEGLKVSENTEDQTETQMLYQAAKIFVEQLRAVEA